MAKASPRRSPGKSNAALTKKVVTAQAQVDIARAKADLVKAKIEVQGKRIAYDYKNGVSTVKVVDGLKP